MSIEHISTNLMITDPLTNNKCSVHVEVEKREKEERKL